MAAMAERIKRSEYSPSWRLYSMNFSITSSALEKRIRIREHQRVLQDFVHVLDLDQRDILQHLLRDLIDVLLVFLRHEDGLDSATMRREHLLLEPANRQQ